MKFVIEITCDNAAFECDNEGEADGIEITRILSVIAKFTDQETIKVGWFQPLRDINGNACGQAVMKNG